MSAVRATLRRIGLSPITAILWLIATPVFILASLTLFTSVYAFLYLVSVPESAFSIDLSKIKETALDPEKTENVVTVLIATIEAMLLIFKSVNITTSSLLGYFHSYSIFAACYFLFTFFYVPFRLKNPPKKRKQRLDQERLEQEQKEQEQRDQENHEVHSDPEYRDSDDSQDSAEFPSDEGSESSKVK